MAKKASKKKTVRKATEAAVTSRVVRGKATTAVLAAAAAPSRARSEEDWLAQERAELGPIQPQEDLINSIVGRQMYISDASADEWRFKKTGLRLRVLRFYFHEPAIVFDKPSTTEEMKAKAEFFDGTPITYVAVAPNESITPDELRERLVKALAKKKMAAAKAAKAAPVGA